MPNTKVYFNGLLQRIDEAIEQVSYQTDQLPQPKNSTPEQLRAREELNARYTALQKAYGKVVQAQMHFLASPENLAQVIARLKAATAEAQAQVDRMNDILGMLEAADKIADIVTNLLLIVT